MPGRSSLEGDTLLEHSDGSILDAAPHGRHISPYAGSRWRIGAAMYSFAVLGLFASSVGVMLPSLAQYYSLGDAHVSLIFVVGPVGYILAAQVSSFIHWTWGQRGIALLAPILHIVSALLIATHPPFGLVLVAFAAANLGIGLLDGSWCAWAATLPHANTVSGMLQGSYSVGAAAGPFFAGFVLPTLSKQWYAWGYVLAAASVIELCVLLFAFRHETAARYREEKPPQAASLRATSKYITTWLIALYCLAYVGIETAISGWIVSFMTRNRNGPPNWASIASSGFWGGMAIGRFVLGIITDKLGVGRANTFYFLIAIALQMIFSLLPGTIESVIFISMIGFFMGPMYPSGVVVLTRQLPAELHVAAVSFTASAGQAGAAILPFTIGVVIQTLGIGVFPAAVIVLSILALLAWLPASRQRP
ncbi:Bypass of stop codon protein [Lachnellula suecica]|uniref:Bypass of stop codon protein n=1 Tax=Lachnellula suecica TaxID=602035 RepID=A0A8T9BXF8_9HELO|nr:Bypass of stop codon protein [Lachnellula suecica]